MSEVGMVDRPGAKGGRMKDTEIEKCRREYLCECVPDIDTGLGASHVLVLGFHTRKCAQAVHGTQADCDAVRCLCGSGTARAALSLPA
ncbi:hypothetical protein ACOMHN_025238 [Nucella lapillus]